MTHKEIFEALLAGKKLTWAYSVGVHDRWVQLQGQNLLYSDGVVADGLILGEKWAAWRIYEEPNPHTPGTFAWAREEARRGKRVRRTKHRAEASNPDFQGWFSAFFVPDMRWALSDIDATDWESVT